jgi:hypothetical protein
MSDLLSHQFFVSAMHTVTGFLEKQYADTESIFKYEYLRKEEQKGTREKSFSSGPMYSMNVVKNSGNALQKLQH